MADSYSNIKKHLITCSETAKVTTITKTDGCSYVDENGEEYLNVNDISCVLGYNHLKYNKRVSELVLNKTLGHLSTFSKDKELLIERLMNYTHNSFDKIFFAGSGGEVVDWSIKLARRATGKDNIVSFNNSLHGRSFAGAFLSGTPLRKEGFGTGLENVYFWDFPEIDDESYELADEFKDIAGIIIEPLQALGGMVFPNKKYWKWLREYCDRNNIILIFDEIQTGFGKTGAMFAYELTGIIPDILLMGKGMSNGFGLGALLMNEKVSQKVSSAEMSGGSADNELLCSIVNTVLDIYEEDKILENVLVAGRKLKEGLNDLIDKKIIDGTVNGEGLFLSLKTNNPEEIIRRTKDKNILLGRKGDYILFRPPLIIKEEEIDKIINAIKIAD